MNEVPISTQTKNIKGTIKKVQQPAKQTFKNREIEKNSRAASPSPS